METYHKRYGTSSHKGDINTLLPIYRKEVDKFLKRNGRMFVITIQLEGNFLREAEERIIEGNRKYGNDWRRKNNLKEIDAEKLDIFNYTILHICQKQFKKLHL